MRKTVKRASTYQGVARVLHRDRSRQAAQIARLHKRLMDAERKTGLYQEALAATQRELIAAKYELAESEARSSAIRNQFADALSLSEQAIARLHRERGKTIWQHIQDRLNWL